MDLLRHVWRRTRKIIQGMECLSYEDRLRELRLCSLEERRLRGGPENSFSVFKGRL